MKRVEDKVVMAVVHGLIAAGMELANKHEDYDFDLSGKGIEYAKQYLRGERIDGLSLASLEGTVEFINEEIAPEYKEQA